MRASFEENPMKISKEKECSRISFTLYATSILCNGGEGE
jgi:hypothetical protein